MTRRIRAAAAQFQHLPGDKPADAAAQGAQLVVFPECCISGYWHLRRLELDALEALAEPVFEGPSTRALVELSARLNIMVGAGLVESAPDGLFNTFVVAMPDGGLVKHRKLHVFVNPHLRSGDSYTVFDTPLGVRTAVLICYDNNIIENARSCALAGAELLLAPHQTGGCDSGSPFAMGRVDRRLWDRRAEEPAAIEAEFRGDKGRGWLMRWLPARAHDNGLFLVFSNGVGPDDDEVRTGNAMILDCYGRILAESCRAGDDLVVADLDLSLRERCTGYRWLRARRPELYSGLTIRTGIERDTRSVRFG